jgi:hypothetical protein
MFFIKRAGKQRTNVITLFVLCIISFVMNLANIEKGIYKKEPHAHAVVFLAPLPHPPPLP